MLKPQPAIREKTPPYARYLTLHRSAQALTSHQWLKELGREASLSKLVVGLSGELLRELGSEHSCESYPDFSREELILPRTQASLWVWLRGDDRLKLLHEARRWEERLSAHFTIGENLEAFTHDGGRDLTGYEDGTENPKDDKLEEAAFVSDGPARAGSYVALQRWQHSFASFEALSPSERDAAIGRELETNEELEDAPPSAHVKRTAQESFEPEAFVLRRSMPWLEGSEGGLYFVAFGRSLSPFAAQMRRMTGEEDGIKDALFRFSRPLTGGYYFCPALVGSELAL